MFLRKGLFLFVLFGLLICTGEATAGPNANAVLSLDLIADGGAGNQIDNGVTLGTVSGQGTKIVVEVFAKGVTTPLLGATVEFGIDASVLTYVKTENSAFVGLTRQIGHGVIFLPNAPVTLPASGFLARAEFITAVDVTDREFSIGIKKVLLIAEGQTSSEEITTTEVIRFNAPSPDFNEDGIVNIPDFLLFVDVFGTEEGDQDFDARMDLNGNGQIDIADFLVFVEIFGMTTG
ncbi:MAG: dockerin type I domain-containing protein [Candidatus Poribacteria bacterium]|nr:dockerin type I domain-containing protein [Candidatus Poribacteria bacterium]